MDVINKVQEKAFEEKQKQLAVIREMASKGEADETIATAIGATLNQVKMVRSFLGLMYTSKNIPYTTWRNLGLGTDEAVRINSIALDKLAKEFDIAHGIDQKSVDSYGWKVTSCKELSKTGFQFTILIDKKD